MRSPRRAHSSSLRFWQTYSVRAISARRRVQGCIHAGSPRSLLTSLSPNCSRAPCGDTNLRQCAAHSTARRTAPSPVRPPSSPQAIALVAHRKQLLALLLKADPTRQRQSQIHIAELPRTLDANALQANRHRQRFAAIVKKLRSFRIAEPLSCQFLSC
jgi:hypothetical protein